MKRVSLFTVSSVLAAASAFAQPPHATPVPENGRFAAVQEQLDALAARISSLETDSHAPPSSSVEGRTYCAALTTTIFQGAPALSVEIDRVAVFRAEMTFSGGVVSGTGISNWDVSQNGDGQIGVLQNPPPFGVPGPIFGQTYTQSGSKIDLMVGNTPWTLYVSADGSLMHGNRIFRNSLPPMSFAGLSTIVYVEDATGAGCNPETGL